MRAGRGVGELGGGQRLVELAGAEREAEHCAEVADALVQFDDLVQEAASLQGGLAGRGDGRHEAGEHLHLVRGASGALGGVPQGLALGPGVFDGVRVGVDAAGVMARQLQAVTAAARLEDDWLALLGRGDGQRAAGGGVLALQVDRLDLVHVGEPLAVDVEKPGVLLPAAPQPLHDLDDLVGTLVLLRARWDRRAEVRRGGGVGGGHRVPAGPAVADHVQGLELAGEIVGLGERGGGGGDQADPLGLAREDGQDQQRVDHVVRGMVLEVDVQDRGVRDEQQLDLAALGGLRVTHELIHFRVVVQVRSRQPPGPGCGPVTAAELHAQDHLSACHGCFSSSRR